MSRFIPNSIRISSIKETLRSGITLLMVTLLTISGSAAIVRAQESTPMATSQTAGQERVFPASIHQGTCDNLGQVMYPLADVGLPDGGEVLGDPGIPAYVGSTALADVTIDALLAESHVVAVSASAEDLETIVACGQIGGTSFGDNLLFGLGPGENPDFAGTVLLTAEADGSLTVDLYLIINANVSSTDQVAQPEASPQAGTEQTEQAAEPTPVESEAVQEEGDQGEGAAQSEVTVEMIDMAFNPGEFTIPANTDVTIILPNNGAALHNFSVDDNQNPDVSNLGISVDAQPGESVSVTVNAPVGDYYFYCNVPGHEAAGMFGVMHVVEQ